MKILTTLSRRAFVAGQTALAALVAVPSAASAASSVSDVSGTGDVVTAAPPVAPAQWKTATADHLEPLLGERFRVRSHEHGSYVLRLASVERTDAGPARPAHLARGEGVTVTFDGPDAAILSAFGDQTLRVSHARLGTEDVFMVPTPTRSGRAELELILN